MAAQVTGLDIYDISKMVGLQLPFLSLVVPFWLVLMMSGRKGAREVWPAALVSGGSFGIAQWLSSNYLGPFLPDILSALVSMACLVAFLRVWHPASTFRFAGERDVEAGTAARRSSGLGVRETSRASLVWAWSPFIVLTVLVANWGARPVKSLLDTTTLAFPFPLIHNAVTLPGTGAPLPAVFTFNWLSATGSATIIAGLVSVVIARMSARTALVLFGRTLASMAAPLLTIASVLGLAYIGNSSGMTRAMGIALASTGVLFPLFSPVLGWLGVFVTGSDTSSNAVFGRLQTVSAERTGMDPILAIAANSSGGVTGKMISPQSIAVACAATGLVGKEASLFRFTLVHSVLLLAIIAVMTLLQATVLSWMVP
jgi:lactate permease